jgi:hypothetical protein
MKTPDRGARWWHAVPLLLIVFHCLTSTTLLAKEFRIDLPELKGTCQYGRLSTVVPVDLGTPLVDVSAIKLELSGSHTAGWWVGDMVEDHYVGPKGGMIEATMDSASSFPSQWSCSYNGQGNGSFVTTLILHQNEGVSDWSFLRDGVTDLTLQNSPLIGWGGFTTPPSFDLAGVTLLIEATPVPEPCTVVILGFGAFGVLAHILRRRKLPLDS